LWESCGRIFLLRSCRREIRDATENCRTGYARAAGKAARALAARVREQLNPDGGFLVVAFGATLNVLPPGSRRDNRFWIVRGTLADGRRIEASSNTAERDAAERFARSLAAGHTTTEARRR
jgi:hypothetical protein